MKQVKKVFTVLLITYFAFPLLGFKGIQRFSDEFYAAQKYFYNAAKNKYPKIIKEKAYPEVPIQGNIEKEALNKIEAIRDYLTARKTFIEEVQKYPELIYPEIFQFLFNHPALQVSASNKLKFEALEKYFAGFYFLFNNDAYAYFHPQVKCSPCPLVFCYSDDKKSEIRLNISNFSKQPLNLYTNQGTSVEYLLFKGKNPVTLKSSGSQTLKFDVNLQKLKTDTTYRVMQIILADPSHPKIKLTIPIILLPNQSFLKQGAQFYDLKYIYTSHLKNIDLYSDRSSGPERCSGKNCSGELRITLRNKKRKFEQYNFGDAAIVQLNLRSSTYPQFSAKHAYLEFELNELGELQGKARDCPGSVPESISPCPPETPNNGKQLYGTRKLETMIYVPPGKMGELFLELDFEDFKKTFSPNDVRLSWLENKKLHLQVSDSAGNILHKELVKSSHLKSKIINLNPGKYNCSVFPVNEDQSTKQNPAFEINHLNQAAKAQFYFKLKGKFLLRIT